MAILHCFIEVDAERCHKTNPVFHPGWFSGIVISGYPVTGAIVAHASDHVVVPCFGYCNGVAKPRRPRNIHRWFNIDLAIDGYPGALSRLCGAYWLVSGVARLEVCGVAPPLPPLKVRNLRTAPRPRNQQPVGWNPND